MNSIELDMMKGMVSILNEASEAYYNTGKPIMTDAQFDARLKKLVLCWRIPPRIMWGLRFSQS